MDLLLSRVIRNALAAFAVFFGVAKEIDYKTLNRYILNINQMHDLEGILMEVSRCLKEILNYRLFAFAVQDDEKLNVWIDPGIYRKSLGEIIKKDFGYKRELKINYLYEGNGENHNQLTFNSSNLLTYALKDDKYAARLYILPHRKIFGYHSEIMGIILKTLGIALSNFMSLKKLENAASIDSLTGCYNRRDFNMQIDRNIANAHRYKKHLSLIMLDLDHFKKVNDTYGHQAGDIVLKIVSQTIQHEIRKGDFLSRYGGEEFVLMLPETELAKAIDLADRLRRVMEKLDIHTLSELVKYAIREGLTTLET